MDGFPQFQFHKDLAPEGKLFKSQAELDAAGPGWVDTPAEFQDNQQGGQEKHAILDHLERDAEQKHEDLPLLEKEPEGDEAPAKRRGRKPKAEG